jgi:hypothetical protein
MLADPICLPARTSATAAAMAMRDAGIPLCQADLRPAARSTTPCSS